MSLRRVLHDLQTKELEQVEALDLAKVLITDFHKGIDDAPSVLILLCEKYPLVLKRSIQSKTILSSVRTCITKYGTSNCLVPLTRAIVRSSELISYEAEQREWLLNLVSELKFREQALLALNMVELTPQIEYTLKKNKLFSPEGMDGVTPFNVCAATRYIDSIQKAKDLDDNPRLNSDLLAQFPSIVASLLPETPKQPLTIEWKRAFEEFLEDETYIKDNDARITAVNALLALFTVYQPNFALNHDTAIGAWIIGCICSRNRPLRLRAVQLLSSFIDDNTPANELAHLFANTLKLQLKENQPADAHYETVIMAWKAGAISCELEHLNFFLVKLIGEFSSPNPVKNSLALEQLQSIADIKSLTPYQLFMPFLKTIAVIMVQKNDQILDQFSALCGIPREVFLVRTARATLPSLVLFERSEIIKNLARAHSVTVERLIRDNVGPIVALLLTSSSSPEEFAERKLRAVSRESLGFGIRSIVSNKRHARDIVAELLKLSQSCEHSKIIVAINYIFPEKLDLDVVFNLISLYTQDLCFNKHGKLFPIGKSQYLEGLRVLMDSGLANLFNIRTQVFTLLQSEMNEPLTTFYSLKTWLAMLQHLDNVEKYQSRPFYDLTIAVISYKWSTFDEKARHQSKHLLGYILSDSGLEDLILSKGLVWCADPDFSAEVGKRLSQITAKYPLLTQFRQIVNKCSQENFYIVCQSTYDLYQFIEKHQEIITIQLRGENEIHDLQQAIRVIISVAKRFDSPDLRSFSANCLGLLGALDPYRVDLEIPADDRPIVLDSFGVKQESDSFIVYITQNYLLPELQATSDPDLQMYLGYVIQEFLKFCGLGPENREDVEKMFPANGSLLSPFLYTKYKINPSSQPAKEYPIYKPQMPYSTWLRIFSFDVMSRANGGNASAIIGRLGYLFSKDRDISHLESIARFVLPYAILNSVLSTPSVVDLFALEFTTVLNQSVDSQASLIHQCIFSIFDYLALWMRQKRVSTSKSKDLKNVEILYNNISPFTLGERAIECQNYPRAIRYWEQTIRNRKLDDLKLQGNHSSMIVRFSSLYANLGDIDSMEGVSNRFNTWTPEQRILQYKTTEQWDAAIASYSLHAQDLNTWDTKVLEGMLECYRASGRPELALSYLGNVDMNIVTPKLVDIATESSWVCEDWNQFDKWCKLGSSNSLTNSVAGCIYAFKTGNIEQFQASVAQGKLLAIEDIAKQEVTTLVQIRPEMLFLHAICDVSAIATDADNHKLPKLLTSRLNRVGANFQNREYLLSLRRVLYKLSGEGDIAGTYYESARDARKSGRYVTALECILKAREFEHPLAVREHAKLLWKQGRQQEALTALKCELNGFDVSYEKLKQSFKTPTPTILAKNALLYTEWLDSSGYATTEELVGRYNAVAKMQPRWDKVYQRHAKHWLKIYDYQLQMDPENRELSFYDGTLFNNISLPLFRTLRYGSKYVEESMPKFLTLWLDFSSQEQADSVREELSSVLQDYEVRNIMDLRQRTINDFNRMFTAHLKDKGRIPAYFFYNSLPQLLSRITSVNNEVFSIIKSVVTIVCRSYPHQAVWSLIEATKSDNNTRRKRGVEILKSVISSRPDIVGSAVNVIDEFVNLCSFDLRQHKSLKSCTLADLKFDQSVIHNYGHNITVPIQKFMENVMPSPGMDMKNHNAFPLSASFYSIENNVDIMSSLQRPKKITIRASDGNLYGILCKGHDDVRKDARLLHFSSTINQLLSRDEASLARHLRILSYKVVPLMDKGGLIEWVDGAVPTRKLIRDLQESRGVKWNYQKFQTLLDAKLDPARRVRNFEIICDEVSPVLYESFLRSFPEPSAWLKARNLYTQSTAVMSIVGYILGLGDRHLENLLIVQHTGMCLHVDFDCLFEKGSTFAIPEVVPFRLTQNMIDAFGVHGYEGPFRKSCEITLELLNKNEGLLMTILEPFVHDPVIISEHQRRNHHTPKKQLQKIQKKLNLYKMPNGLSPIVVGAPLSVQGLVEDLIKTATDPARLSKMYIGWCAFL